MKGKNAYFDGKSQGCRSLHDDFALHNSKHCPHISFVLVKDDEGAMKCQISSKINVLDLFDREDIDQFEQFCLDVGGVCNPDCYKIVKNPHAVRLGRSCGADHANLVADQTIAVILNHSKH